MLGQLKNYGPTLRISGSESEGEQLTLFHVVLVLRLALLGLGEGAAWAAAAREVGAALLHEQVTS
jgi:hypothetical protein